MIWGVFEPENGLFWGSWEGPLSDELVKSEKSDLPPSPARSQKRPQDLVSAGGGKRSSTVWRPISRLRWWVFGVKMEGMLGDLVVICGVCKAVLASIEPENGCFELLGGRCLKGSERVFTVKVKVA